MYVCSLRVRACAKYRVHTEHTWSKVAQQKGAHWTSGVTRTQTGSGVLPGSGVTACGAGHRPRVAPAHVARCQATVSSVYAHEALSGSSRCATGATPRPTLSALACRSSWTGGARRSNVALAPTNGQMDKWTKRVDPLTRQKTGTGSGPNVWTERKGEAMTDAERICGQLKTRHVALGKPWTDSVREAMLNPDHAPRARSR